MQEKKMSPIGRMLDELEFIESMEYVSSETRHRAKQEILKNIEAYEKGWKRESRHFICK